MRREYSTTLYKLGSVSGVASVSWSPWNGCHEILGASVHQVTEIVCVSLSAHLAYLAHLTSGVSCISSISILNIYKCLMSPL